MSALTIDSLRKYIKDTPMINKVFAGVEFQDEDYTSAIFWGAAQQEGVPPFINDFSSSDLPIDLQRIGALAALFEMAALYALRNMSNLSEAGVAVPVGENGVIYEKLAEKYEKKFTEKVHHFKVKVNIERAMQTAYQGGVYGENNR